MPMINWSEIRTQLQESKLVYTTDEIKKQFAPEATRVSVYRRISMDVRNNLAAMKVVGGQSYYSWDPELLKRQVEAEEPMRPSMKKSFLRNLWDMIQRVVKG